MIRRIKSLSQRAKFIFAALLLIATLAIFPWQKAKAFSNVTQSDWSNGVGTDPEHQYGQAIGLDTNTPNQITVNGDSSNWCDTSNCSTSWSRRQAVYINNYQGDAANDKSIHLTIPYDGQMQNDFDDIRFTNDSGNTDLEFFLYAIENNDRAEAVVKIPEIAAHNVTTLYMYYGNGNVDSTSSHDHMNLYDDFTDDSVSLQWDHFPAADHDDLGVMASGVYSFDQQYTFKSSNEFDRSVDRAYEFDISSDVSNTACGNNGFPYSVFVTLTIFLSLK